MEGLIREFIAESQEGLDRMERCLTTLETRPDDPELIAEIFRTVHTIKGTTGFLALRRLETLAHAAEALLSALRSGKLAVTTELITLLLELTDRFRQIIRLVETTGGEGTRATDRDDQLMEALREWTTQQSARIEAATGNRSFEPSMEDLNGSRERTIRVEVDLLNRMMNLVGELVLTRNQIQQAALATPHLAPLARRLDNVTSDLRETMMEARMQPVGVLFDHFPRLVRDLAKTCERVVRVEFRGQETRLDRSILEAIKDPLTHALRNAIDHGIESPATRIHLGKPVMGLIRLRAFQKSGSVLIEISDDGSGIAIDKVRAKAVEQGLFTPASAERMSDREALQMVFLPGLSTASKVTRVSGRGVGMDVVRSNVERVGGSVELESVPGEGTTLRLRVPLTLAIIPALMVLSDGQTFALPQSAVEELVYISRSESAYALDTVEGHQTYNLRDRPLPIVHLDRLFDAESDADREQQAFYLAVLAVEGFRFGLMLDDLLGQEEIVVKPLSKVLRDIGLFSGAMVQANGQLALILDAAMIAARAGVKPDVQTNDLVSASIAESTAQRFVTFDDGHRRGRDPARTAIPLELIERIETIPITEIRYAHGSPRIDYRGETLDLEDASGLIVHTESYEGAIAPSITTLICRQQENSDRRVAIVVKRVFDIACGSLLDSESPDKGQFAMIDSQKTFIPERFAGSLTVPHACRSLAAVR